jgi:ATP-dependent RNA helicase DeaD
MSDVAAGFPVHLHPTLLSALAERDFAEPTPVQREVLAEQHRGRDLLVSSQTGSGKTVAFGVAAADGLVASLGATSGASVGEGARLPAPRRHQPPNILVIAPTRELALQVQRELSWLYDKLGARVASCVGGVDVHRERRALFGGVHVVVGTPGRLVDHLTRKSLDLSAIDCVVLDEADEMLDMGFREELETILDACPPSPPEGSRRTLLFSATLPPAIVALARKYQREAVRVIATSAEAHQDIEVKAHLVATDEREHAVVNVLRYYEPARALVFVALRETVTRLQARLVERGFSAVGLSGELSQAERTRALQALRDGRARVLVATDVAARGLDLPEVSLVVHGDVANDPVSMTHRNGRTGRAGRKGVAVVLATPPMQRAAEMQLLAVGARTPWTPLPSAADVRVADGKRLFSRVAEEVAFLEPEDRAVGQELLDAHGPDTLAALLARTLRAALPQAEEVAGSLALRPDQPGKPRKKPWSKHPPGRRGPRPGPRPPERDERGEARAERRPPPRDERGERGPRDQAGANRPRPPHAPRDHRGPHEPRSQPRTEAGARPAGGSRPPKRHRRGP